MGKQPQKPPPRETRSPPSRDLKALPDRVQAMRALILEAVADGDVEALRPAIERNETLPIFTTGPGRPRTFAEAVDFLKARSFDGAGRETLAIIQAIFEQPYAKITRGPVVTYEWPAFETGANEAEAGETRAQMWRCMRFSGLGSLDKGAQVERIGIGADGTWHYFAPDG